MRPTRAQCLFAAGLLVILATAAIFGFAGEATYERIGVRESVHRGMFRAPACDLERCEVQATTYPMGTLVKLHLATADFVVGGESDVPMSPTAGAFYTPAEVSYLAQLRRMFTALLVTAGGGALLLALLTARASNRPALIRGGAALAALFGALFAAAVIIITDEVMKVIDDVVGVGGVVFDQRFNLFWLYPSTYGQTVLTSVALTIPVAAGLVAAAAHLWMSRGRLRRVEAEGRVERGQAQH
jgi:hypothetical protein